jgi:hypothetical protein
MPNPSRLPDWRAEREDFAPFAMVELIAVDLDGSLVQANAASVLDQIQSVQHGLGRRRASHPAVKLTYATGRSLTWVASLLKGLRLRLPSGTPLVLYNGSVVIESHTGVVLARREIPPAAFREVKRLTTGWHATLHAYSGPTEWPTSLGSVEEVFGWGDSVPASDYDINGSRVHWNPVAMDDSFAPVAALVRLPRDAPGCDRALGRLQSVAGISLTRSAGDVFEIRPEGSNKAVGLQVAIAHMGINRERVLALGDSENDIEMLRWAGLAVSVANATPAALANSDFVTRAGAAQGALEVLRTVKHARRWFPLAREVN